MKKAKWIREKRKMETVEAFLALSPEKSEYIELKLALSEALANPAFGTTKKQALTEI